MQVNFYLKRAAFIVVLPLMAFLMVSRVSAGSDLVVYDDQLADDWANWSLMTSVEFGHSAPTHSGNAAIAVTFNQPYAAFYLRSQTTVMANEYQSFHFWLHGGSTGGHEIQLTLMDSNNNPIDNPMVLTPQSETWTEVEIPLSGDVEISGVILQDISGETQGTFFIDEMSFVGNEEPPAPGATFLETFDGEPASPSAWNPVHWDITVHSRDRDTWFALEPMEAHHNENCDPPPSTHTITAYEETVYQCRNHVMTAINSSSYGLIYLTPNHLVDFSQGEAVVRFDVSTARTSERDWIDLWVTPYEHNLQLALDEGLPDLNGEPREAVHFRLDFSRSRFKGKVIHDFASEELPRTSEGWLGYESFLEPSPKVRQTFELRISENHIKFGMPEHDFWWVDTDLDAPLGWDQGIIQLGHHSYNPTKDCDDCSANTWHWDNVSIEPALPFTIIPADKRYLDADTEPVISFANPAPANSHLRFAGIGNNIEVSFDGGQTWETAQLQAQEDYADEHFRSYWTPVPEATTEVHIRGERWWGAGWHVRDISIWSPETPINN